MKKSLLLAVILIILLSVYITVVNLGNTKNFLGQDGGVIYGFSSSLQKLTYFTWFDQTAPGKINVTTTLQFVWNNLVLFLLGLHLNTIIIERILYLLFFILSGTGMFFLIIILFIPKLNRHNRQLIAIGAFTGALLYMFNHYSMWLASFAIIPYHLFYMFLPWAFGLLVINIQYKTSFFLCFLFVLSFLIISGSNPANTIVIIGIFFIYLLFFFRNIKIKFIITSTILVLLLASYTIIPMIFIGTNPYGNVNVLNNQVESLTLHSSLTSLSNLFRLAGIVVWPDFPYYQPYNNNPLLIIIGYLIPLWILASLHFPSPLRKLKKYLFLLILIFLFLASGSHQPIGQVFLSLYRRFSFLAMFRAIYPKFAFVLVFAYSILIGISIFDAGRWFNKKLLIIIPLIIVLYHYPFFIGQIPRRDFLNTIPAEYINASRLIDKNDDYKILSLPPAPGSSSMTLKWGNDHYIGPIPDSVFFDKPALDSYWFITNKYFGLTNIDSWVGNKFEKNIEKSLDMANVLNIKYLVVHKDFPEDYQFMSGSMPIKIDGKLKADTLISSLKKIQGIRLREDNRFFNLYELPSKYLLPHIYVIGANYSSAKINPTRYKVTISKANKPFRLVLSETFDPHWNVNVASSHYLANGYANGWLIQPTNKNMEVTIEFGMQKYFYIGLFVSTITFLASIIYILYKRR